MQPQKDSPTYQALYDLFSEMLPDLLIEQLHQRDLEVATLFQQAADWPQPLSDAQWRALLREMCQLIRESKARGTNEKKDPGLIAQRLQAALNVDAEEQSYIPDEWLRERGWK